MTDLWDRIDAFAESEHERTHEDLEIYRFTEIDELPLSPWQKKCVLEWFANHLWMAMLETDVMDSHCKSYDPLLFDYDEDTVHSYVFDLWDGGRHHRFQSLSQVERSLHGELVAALASDEAEEEESIMDVAREFAVAGATVHFLEGDGTVTDFEEGPR